MDEKLEERKEKFLGLIKQKKTWLAYLGLAVIILLAYLIRIRNLWLLNGQLADPDAHLFYRYAEYILAHGKLFVTDMLRYYPVGYYAPGETQFFSYMVVWVYKILHFFNSSLTLKFVDIIFPAIMFIPALIFFYLLVKKLFDYRVALLSSLLLAIIPAFLFRTISGVSDKECLAIPLMFAALYFYVSAFKSKKLAHIVIFSSLAGIFTALTGMSWGGVQFIFLTISLFILILVFLNKSSIKDFYSYTIWYFIMVILLLILAPGRFVIRTFMGPVLISITTLAFFVILIDYLVIKKDLFKIKQKLENKLPPGFSVFIIAFILGIIASSFIAEPLFTTDKINFLITKIVFPFEDRWSMTVAESHQPYISDWISQLGWGYLLMVIIGSILLSYELTKNISKKSWQLTALFILLIVALIFSRYSASSVFNGQTPIAKTFYLGTIAFFILMIIILFIRLFYKNKEIYEKVRKIDRTPIFVLIWFIVMIIAARTAIRLVFVFAPITAILVGYLIFRVFDMAKNFKSRSYTIITWIVLLVIILAQVNTFARATLVQSKYTGPIYNAQWQNAEVWVKANTQENAVFAHWWDYGYLVQTGFNRATITDGGNAIGAWNFFMGRHVLMAQNETEALEFLKTHEATNLLIISDEIGKYPAFSSIGSDENYDRYSWINVFSLNKDQIQETRNQTIYLYAGGTMLDEDIIYQGKVLPKQVAGIGGFFVPVQTNGDQVTINQPTAVLFYNNQRIDLPLNCVFMGGKEINFQQSNGINGCLQIIPTIESETSMNQIGAALYISPRVRRTLFADLYLFGKESNNFKLAYSDENSGMPLAIYQGRVIGPLKIWEISYPAGIKKNPIYLNTTYPNVNVTRI